MMNVKFGEVYMKLLRSLLIIICGLYAVNVSAMGYTKDYVACMASSDNQASTASVCQLKEFRYQEKRLKKLFKQNMRMSNEQQKLDLKRIQNQWATQRELSCGLKNKKLKQLNPASVGCALQMTSSRADLLEVQVTNKNLRR